ncbi:hypothetical protein, partial [Trinickia fusca]
VAIGAIGGAVGAEVGEYAPALKGADDFTSFARGAGQAALSNAISQGVDVATGLQHHFDWRGVAASAIAGGVNSEVGQTSVGKVPVLGNIVSGVASQTAGGVVLGGSMRDRLPRMIGAIAGNTVGSEIEQQVQSNGTSTLYGGGGNVDELVAQSGYAADPGKQFAWSANSRLNPDNGFDTTAASLGLTPQQARGLMAVDNGASIVGSSFSPEVVGYAVPYPQIAVSPLPESNVRLAQTEGGFGRGLFGPPRNVFEQEAPLSEQLGRGVRWVADTFALDPLKEVGSQYRDVFSALGGARDGWSSSFAQQVMSGDYAGAALSEVGTVGSVMPLAGAGLKGVSWAAAGSRTEQMAGRLVPGLQMNIVPEGSSIALKPPIPRVNVADDFAYRENKNGSVTLQYGDPEGVHGLIVNVDRQGVLGFDIRSAPGGSSLSNASGTDMFASAMERLEREGVQVNAIRGMWIGGTDSVNAAQYLSNLDRGMPPQQAAANTWTGRMVARYGYTNVGMPNTGYSVTTVIFGR